MIRRGLLVWIFLAWAARGAAQTPAAPASPPAAAEGSAAAPPAGLALPDPGTQARTDVADFTVGDIRVEGLQRISEGTVYNYLPVNIGDKLTPRRVREAIRALYATGFFRDVQLRREGNTLIVAVLERPSIESFEITGNKDIKTEDLQKSLRNVGLAAGKTFDRSVLEDVTNYLTDQYFSRGKYAVRVDTKVDEESGNRVKVKIDIHEGKRAKIREINVVGNRAYTDKQVEAGFELHTPNWLSWYKQDDRYSRESLEGDLERLRSFYMDRGYANFAIGSTQVAIAPEKDDIFITVNIDEGKVFTVAEVKLAGTFVVPQADLEKLLLIHPGQIFSRKAITASQELMQNRMGEDGYAFAKVEPVPTTDNQKNTVSLTFFIDPGNRVYVRNISFSGVTKINDEVLRREMRQLEGGWLSNVALERSKQRLQRLPYIKKVESETTPVPGSPDQVDVNYKIEEGPGAQLSGGLGYSQLYKLTVNGNYTDANFLGTGERISVDLEGGAYNQVYSLSHTDPYSTINGLVRTESFTYRDISQFIASSSQFSTKIFTLGLNYSYPISEFQFLSAGVNVQHSQLVTIAGESAIQSQQWVQQNGSPYRTVGSGLVYDYTLGTYVNEGFNVFGTKYDELELIAGWSFDSRNKTLFADRGRRQTLSLLYTPSLWGVSYYKANYEFSQYIPIYKKFFGNILVNLGYGAGLGKTTSLPPYQLFFGGGPDSVRGFYEGYLGPRDQFGNPYGGNMNVLGRAELYFPMPEKFASSARVAAFFDIGNVFFTNGCKNPYAASLDPAAQRCTEFYAPPFGYGISAIPGSLGPPTNAYDFKYNNLKRSVGIAVQWLAPLGLFRFSFAFPLNAQREVDGVTWGDNTERFQFSIGQAF